MAEEKKEEGAAEKPKGPGLGLATILGALNALILLAAVGVTVYTKILYKPVPITEKDERESIKKKAETLESDSPRGAIEFKSFTTNIKATKLPPKVGAPPDQDGLHLHYATISMVLETRAQGGEATFEEVRPKFMDLLIQLLGKKSMEELGSVQGRFVLRNEILDLANTLLGEPFVTNVFFSEFLVN